jgi:multiple sugar transport system substrate-binding protein
MSVVRSVRGLRALRAAGAGVVAMGLLAAGCGGGGGGGGSAGGKVTIRYSWWGDASRAVMIKKSVALFEKKNPGITVKTDFQEYADFWKKFATQAAGGGAPDVFQNSAAFLRKYGEKSVLLDLNSQVNAGSLSLSGFRAGLEKAGDIDGKLYGVPVGGNTFALVYDVEAFKKAGITPRPGWTWDEFNAGVEKISKTQKIKGTTGNAGVMYLYDLVLRQQGKAFYAKDNKLGFTKDDLKKWWDDNLAEVRSGTVVPQNKVDQATPKSVLSSGLSASEFTWDNFIVRYAAESDTKFALAPIPTTDGKTTGSTSPR